MDLLLLFFCEWSSQTVTRSCRHKVSRLICFYLWNNPFVIQTSCFHRFAKTNGRLSNSIHRFKYLRHYSPRCLKNCEGNTSIIYKRGNRFRSSIDVLVVSFGDFLYFVSSLVLFSLYIFSFISCLSTLDKWKNKGSLESVPYLEYLCINVCPVLFVSSLVFKYLLPHYFIFCSLGLMRDNFWNVSVLSFITKAAAFRSFYFFQPIKDF